MMMRIAKQVLKPVQHRTRLLTHHKAQVLQHPQALLLLQAQLQARAHLQVL